VHRQKAPVLDLTIVRPLFAALDVKPTPEYFNMPSEEKYMELFTKGCKLSEGLIQLDGQPPKKLGFFDKRKLKKAKSLLELAAPESPDNAAPYLMLAKVSHSLGERSESLNYLLRAWELQPANLILVIELSGAYGVLGKHKEAISVLEEGIKYHPNEPRILFNLGVSYLLENVPKLALDTFKEAVRIEPDFAQNHALLKYSQEILSGQKSAPRNQAEIAQNI
jgi:tetratricopeptide (TPR) repeat protein